MGSDNNFKGAVVAWRRKTGERRVWLFGLGPSESIGIDQAIPSISSCAPAAPHRIISLKIGNKARPRSVRLYRSEEHTSELQSLMRTSSAVFCLKQIKLKKKKKIYQTTKVIQRSKQNTTT